jgi:hypothetical protein
MYHKARCKKKHKKNIKPSRLRNETEIATWAEVTQAAAAEHFWYNLSGLLASVSGGS